MNKIFREGAATGYAEAEPALRFSSAIARSRE